MAFKGGAEGHIRLGIGQNFSTQVMPQAILLFAKARPHIRLSVVVGTSKQLYDMVISGRIEIAVASPIGGVDGQSDLEHQQLAGEYRHNPSYVVVKPDHPLLIEPELSLAALGSYPWCMPESWLTPWENVFELMRKAGASAPDYVLRTDSLTFAKSLLMGSEFISLLGFEAVLTEVNAGLLTAVALPLPTKPAPAYVSYRKGHTLQAGIGSLIHCIERALSGVSGEPPPPR
jgi:LysR family pca operon transcriptional activator